MYNQHYGKLDRLVRADFLCFKTMLTKKINAEMTKVLNE
jgi:hypothetical protein